MRSGVGILGGTFDPPHIGHLLIADAAYRQLGLERVVLIPAGFPWQKPEAPMTPPEHRLGMTRAAADFSSQDVADMDYLEVDDREVLRPGPSYTIDTLLERGDPDPCLILGADAARRLPTWHRAEELMELARIAVAPRPGTDEAEVDAALGGRAEWLRFPFLPISASEMRAQALLGVNIDNMLTIPVREYIAKHRLYWYDDRYDFRHNGSEEDRIWVVTDESQREK